eukprot:CAMPEP_0117681704 /NCGR_PEP_ID=MMETSP0804-20121206/19151_1 /TAXON_ID=1074897 /ORGANISM="Tetraselmis astigmatica, Strain CCMP880" /LENGTH=44 /DNA_ID= /DNA_START= /DNA_END= /DNA_ORIENTATION=
MRHSYLVATHDLGPTRNGMQMAHPCALQLQEITYKGRGVMPGHA